MKPVSKKIELKVVNKPAHARANGAAELKADSMKTCAPRVET